MSEENKNTTANETSGAGTDTATQNQDDKLFTQKDLDALVARRLARERANLPNDVDLHDYREWKKNNSKADDDSKADDTLKNDNQQLKAELQQLKAEQAVLKAQAKPEFAEFVANKVLSLVDDKNTLSIALEKYKKDNPQFFGETVVKRVATSHGMRSDSKGATTNDYMNDILRNRGK